MVLCRLHIVDLGIFERLKTLTLNLLNTQGYHYIMLHNITLGIQCLASVLQSDVVSVSKAHRLRKCSQWFHKWNGGDVSSIMPTITSIWFLVLKPQCLNDKFWNYLKTITPETNNSYSGSTFEDR